MGLTVDFEAGGFCQKELVVLVAKSRGGKSYYFNMSQPNFKIHDQAIVDNATWYTVGCRPKVCEWIREQPKNLWCEHIDSAWQISLSRFDVHEKLYTMIALKWS